MAAAMGDSIQRYPLLRLFVAYVAGLFLGDVLYPYLPSLVSWGMWGALSLTAALWLMWMSRRLVPYGLVAYVAFAVLGVWGYSWARHGAAYDWPPDRSLYEARVLTVPRVRQRSVLCEVEVTAVRDSAVWQRVGHKVFAYMEPSGDAEALSPGDMLCFRGMVRAPRDFSDSLSFDYARYVTMQGVSGTVYLPDGAWRRVGGATGSLRERMLRLRQHLSVEYMAASFRGAALGVLSALTLGDKSKLSAELQAIYSDAGVAHVLALSGMHVGVIYAMTVFLLRGLLRRRGLRWVVRELLAIAVLWAFALLVGMSASVVRAVVMCTVYAVARWVSDGTSSSLHVLSLTALLMLLIRPLYLFDVGFQLSFTAMASILWLEPHVEQSLGRCRPHPVSAYLAGIVCMSLAAQLGTFPLVLYHFGSFPVYFLPSNLIVVPALSVILFLMLVWWVLTLASCSLALPLGALLQHVVGWIGEVLRHISRWPGAVWHVPGYDVLAVLFTYLLILFAGLSLVHRWRRGAVLALASLLGLSVSLLLAR